MSKTISSHNLACIDNLSARVCNFTYMINKAYEALEDELGAIPEITNYEDLNSSQFFLCLCLYELTACSSELTQLRNCLFTEQDF